MSNRKVDTKTLKKIVLTALTWGAIIVSAYYIANPSQIIKNNRSANYNTSYYPVQERMDSH